MIIVYILLALMIVNAGGVFYWFKSKEDSAKREIFHSKEVAYQIIEDAKKEAEKLKKIQIIEAKEEWFKIQNKYEEKINNRQKELNILEKKYNDRVANMDKRLDMLDRKEQSLQDQDRNLRNKSTELEEQKIKIEKMIHEQEAKLQEIAGLTREEALGKLNDSLKEKARHHSAKEVKEIIEEAKLFANKKASEIIVSAIQRLAVDYVSDSTVSVVSLPSEDMKGRIIGREGRNIRAFEKASGIDLIIDDTPEAVVLSGFDPVRREIARLALEKLVLDGRIHPGRIEEVIEKTRKEMDEQLIKIGEEACLETNIHNISPNLIKVIGRLKYRTSYGQNILQHSKEAAWIAGIMAAELGLDQQIAKRAGFLHDIGKALDHELEGSHASIGANLARKNGESKIIVNAIAAHHEEVEPESPYAVLVQAADAVSGARPGARREMLESYMKRLEQLEKISNSIEGVHKSYAIQAGREVRVIVDPSIIDDVSTTYLSQDIASKIEREVQYPGQIKVTVIRETRNTTVAK